VAVAANSVIDYSGAIPTCTSTLVQGVVGTPSCLYVQDPAGDYVITELVCPLGFIALQDSCVSGGSEPLQSTIQNADTVQCYFAAPIQGFTGYTYSTAATCVEMTITSASGAKLVSTVPKISAGASRAKLIASFKN